MTTEESRTCLIGLLNERSYHGLRSNEVIAIKRAISALEKQIAKKPEYSSDGYSPEGLEVWDAHCPNCDHELEEEDICPNCGQAICW